MNKTLPRQNFLTACENGNLLVAQRLLHNHPALLGPHEVICGGGIVVRPFEVACRHNRLNVAQWLIALEPVYGRINLHANHEGAFREAILHGSLDLAQWLISLEPTHGKFDIHANHGIAFVDACGGGCIELVHWLLSLEATHGKIDVHAPFMGQQDQAFVSACVGGHLEIAKFLLSLEPTHGTINVHVEDENAFWETCAGGQLAIAQWLLSLEHTHGRIDVHGDQDQAFHSACMNGYIETAKWLLTLGSNRGTYHVRVQEILHETFHRRRDLVSAWLICLFAREIGEGIVIISECPVRLIPHLVEAAGSLNFKTAERLLKQLFRMEDLSGENYDLVDKCLSEKQHVAPQSERGEA